MTEGKIIKALSGFYYVQANDQVFECRGRGLFRKQKITPLVGDYVHFDAKEKYITNIMGRKNTLSRPPIANIDQALIVSSAKKPKFSSLLLNRFLVMIEAIDIKPIIFINKMDLVTEDDEKVLENYQRDYEQIGYSVELVSSLEEAPLYSFDHYFTNKTTVIAGQTGVGKSALLNKLNPSLLIETDEISERLGRGKHTTRHVELIEVCGGLIADTPGFSSVDFANIELDELMDCFPEVRERKHLCKFRGCMHNQEPQCAIKNAVKNGDIKQYRYDDYLTFFAEIQSRKPRYE